MAPDAIDAGCGLNLNNLFFGNVIFILIFYIAFYNISAFTFARLDSNKLNNKIKINCIYNWFTHKDRY